MRSLPSLSHVSFRNIMLAGAKIINKNNFKIGLAGCITGVFLIIVGVVMMPQAKPSTPAQKQITPASTTKVKTPSAPEPAPSTDPMPETSGLAQGYTAPVQSSNGAASTASPQTSPPFISASTHIEDTTQITSQTCDFTAVMTASALYHNGQVPYAGHTISFTLSLRASDNSANISQTYSYSFAPGETKEFRLNGSFKRPLDGTSYRVTASGVMTVSSGSASLGPNSAYNVVGNCSSYAPLP